MGTSFKDMKGAARLIFFTAAAVRISLVSLPGHHPLHVPTRAYLATTRVSDVVCGAWVSYLHEQDCSRQHKSYPSSRLFCPFTGVGEVNIVPKATV